MADQQYEMESPILPKSNKKIYIALGLATVVAAGAVTFALTRSSDAPSSAAIQADAGASGAAASSAPVTSPAAPSASATGTAASSAPGTSPDAPSASAYGAAASTPAVSESIRQLVHYKTGQFVPVEEAAAKASLFWDEIKEKKGTLLIEGHADSQGNDDNNLQLSQKRAEQMESLLKTVSGDDKGIVMKTNYFGESKPVADNETEDGRALNRRVELIFKAE